MNETHQNLWNLLPAEALGQVHLGLLPILPNNIILPNLSQSITAPRICKRPNSHHVITISASSPIRHHTTCILKLTVTGVGHKASTTQFW